MGAPIDKWLALAYRRDQIVLSNSLTATSKCIEPPRVIGLLD